IAPPRGPLSKPNAGGYSLREALGWDGKTYKRVQVRLHAVCRQYLDIRQPFHEQNSESVEVFIAAVKEKFVILSNYQDAWPARDFATMYLKN
ncbi:hypothetical protein BKA82DRAFT_73621, partial [Pisolithus tinctorius]